MTNKQSIFVQEYLISLNATQAAVMAGYSKKRAAEIGYQLLQKTTVQSAIQEAMKEREKRTEITQDRVIKELARIAFARVDRYLSFNASGVDLKDSSELSEDDLAAIESVSEMLTNAGGYTKFRLHSKEKALELLGNHLGMWKDKQEHTFKDGEGKIFYPYID